MYSIFKAYWLRLSSSLSFSSKYATLLESLHNRANTITKRKTIVGAANWELRLAFPPSADDLGWLFCVDNGAVFPRGEDVASDFTSFSKEEDDEVRRGDTLEELDERPSTSSLARLIHRDVLSRTSSMFLEVITPKLHKQTNRIWLKMSLCNLAHQEPRFSATC